MDMNRFRHAKKQSVNSRFTVTIDEKVIEEFTAYCDANDYVRPKLFELILQEFLDRYEHKGGDEKK
jgi:metal-responsive CopG/Arc/MetJ family transcriptional regulator